MTVKVEIMSADRSSPVVTKGEAVPCPVDWDVSAMDRIRDQMATAAWSLSRTYNLADSKRECRAVVFSFEFSSITGKPACVKD